MSSAEHAARIADALNSVYTGAEGTSSFLLTDEVREPALAALVALAARAEELATDNTGTSSESLFPAGCCCSSYGRGLTMTRVNSPSCPVHKTSGAGDDPRGESHAGTRQPDSLNGPGGTLNPVPEPVPNALVGGQWVHIDFPVDP